MGILSGLTKSTEHPSSHWWRCNDPKVGHKCHVVRVTAHAL